jgi:CheY-like chemotaxis protein
MTEDSLFALIVEDQPDSAYVVSHIFAFNRRPHRWVASAEEALDALSRFHPQVIIADLALPQMTGWDLLHEIRAIPHLANIPVIAITAYYSAHVEREAMELGFNAFLRKPLDTASFIQTVDRVIDKTSGNHMKL